MALETVDTDPDVCHGICQEILRENPDEARALFLVGLLMHRSGKQGSAIACFERVVKLLPDRSEAWAGLGMSYQECHKPVEARNAFKRALELKKTAAGMGNIGVTYLDEGNVAEAIRWCKKAIEFEPDFRGARATLGFAQLGIGNWSEGWKNYDACLGGRFRKELDFQAPRWDGKEVENLVVYGEQGIGDEIMFASCFEDAKGKAKKLTIECDYRLSGLFTRSFPYAEAHGSRHSGDESWKEGRSFDAQVACGSLPGLFRPSPDSCPRKPYLVADPERRLRWRALFDSFKKPVIGICWSGGLPASQKHKRRVGLEAFRPLIESMDAVFVSLEYKTDEAQEEIERAGLPVRVFPALASKDYDDTAALVAELDLVVGIHTSVHHLAGALGKSSIVLVPHLPMWNYAFGDRLQWYPNSMFHRQRKDERWVDCIKRLNLDEMEEAA